MVVAGAQTVDATTARATPGEMLACARYCEERFLFPRPGTTEVVTTNRTPESSLEVSRTLSQQGSLDRRKDGGVYLRP
jgi:hypothetical protein